MRFGFCAAAEHSAMLAAAGYDFVEPPLAATLQPERPEAEVMPNLREGLDGQTIRPEAWNVFLPGDLKVVGPDVDAARQRRYLQTAFARVAALGGQVVVFGSGRSRQVPEDFSRDEARRQALNFLRLAAPEAAAQGVTVAIEPLNTGECNFINSVAEGLALAQEINHPSVKVLSDLYHVNLERQSFAETGAAGSWLAHVHVAGAEERRIPTADDLAYVTSFFRVLKEMDYQGRISVEGNVTDLPRQAPEALGVLHQAWEIV